MSNGIPPGRTGRLWLIARIASARRAAELLNEKRHALLRAERGAADRRQAAETAWRQQALLATSWLDRAALLDGEAAIRRAATAVGSATVEVGWRNAMGARYPESASVGLPVVDVPAALVGSSALVAAREHHRRALEAAAETAAARAAHDVLSAELAATVRRLRAIERRWLPRHETALAELEVSLDEDERAEAVRNNWISRHTSR